MQQSLLGLHWILWLVGRVFRIIFLRFTFFVFAIGESNFSHRSGQWSARCLSTNALSRRLHCPSALCGRFVVSLFVSLVDDNFLRLRVKQLSHEVAGLIKALPL